MAKASGKSIPATSSGKIISGRASVVGKGNVSWTAGARLDGGSDLIVRNPIVAEGGEFSKSAAKANRKLHEERARDELRKAQDAAELGDYLDEIAAKAEPTAAAPPPVVVKPRQVGRKPVIGTAIEAEAQRRIDRREVIPTPKGLAQFARDLWDWWEDVRGNRPAAKSSRSIENMVREIWNAALLKRTKLK